MVLVETERSKQIAILRRLENSDKDIPQIQCISAYTEPDIAELEYHAGTATRSHSRSVVVQFCGVQLSNDHPDQLTAAFLLKACSEPNQDLSLIRTDPVIFGEEMLKLLSDKKYTSVPVMVSDQPFAIV